MVRVSFSRLTGGGAAQLPRMEGAKVNQFLDGVKSVASAKGLGGVAGMILVLALIIAFVPALAPESVAAKIKGAA